MTRGEDLPDTEGWDPRYPVTRAEFLNRTNWPTCQQCGDVLYMGMNQKAKYCSNACRCKAYRQRKGGRPKECLASG